MTKEEIKDRIILLQKVLLQAMQAQQELQVLEKQLADSEKEEKPKK